MGYLESCLRNERACSTFVPNTIKVRLPRPPSHTLGSQPRRSTRECRRPGAVEAARAHDGAGASTPEPALSFVLRPKGDERGSTRALAPPRPRRCSRVRQQRGSEGAREGAEEGREGGSEGGSEGGGKSSWPSRKVFGAESSFSGAENIFLARSS